jgi:hypothetical protein
MAATNLADLLVPAMDVCRFDFALALASFPVY